MTTQNKTVEWAPEHADPHRVIVRINGSNPLSFPTGTGDGSRELRLKVGNNSIGSGILDRLTGGFDSNGVPRRNSGAAVYFKRQVKVTVYNQAGQELKRSMPIAQIVVPTLGEEVHFIADVPGSRSHYKSKQRIKDQASQAAMMAQIQQQSAQITQLLAVVLAKTGGDPVAADPVPVAPTRAESPFDPATMKVSDIVELLPALSRGELEAVLLAEMSGDRRGTALNAIKDAFNDLDNPAPAAPVADDGEDD